MSGQSGAWVIYKSLIRNPRAFHDFHFSEKYCSSNFNYNVRDTSVRSDTPVQDMRRFNYSPVSDPRGEFALTQSGTTEQVLKRLNSLETLVREQHLTTRECTSKALRECLCIERGMHEKLCKQLQLVSEGISAIRDRHQADPVLMSGILGLVNSTLLYLQTTTPATTSVVSSVDMGLLNTSGSSSTEQQQQQQQLQQQKQ